MASKGAWDPRQSPSSSPLNDKAFNGKDTTPLETIQLAKSETESWRIAQIIEKPDEEDDGGGRREPPPTTPRTGLVCFTDASWYKDDTRFGGGMVLATEDGMTTYGSFASNQVLTPDMRSSKLCCGPCDPLSSSTIAL